MTFNIKELQADFDKVILYSQGYSEVKTDKLFEKWYDNKKWFIEANGGSLIYEYPEKISFTIEEEEKMRRIEDLTNTIFCSNPNLARFINFNRKSFYDNVLLSDFSTPDGKKIPKGMKITRAIKFFEQDPAEIDKWQTKISMMLQDTKVTGTLCFSVHPLDFLSSSENNYGWRSCHSLDGDYRAGNLSYMLDSSTIVCYLKGDDDTILPNFPPDVLWNSKKWRMLLFFSDKRTMLFAGRQYPFFNKDILYTIKKGLVKGGFISPLNWISSWTNHIIKEIEVEDNVSSICQDGNTLRLRSRYAIAHRKLTKLIDLITDAPNSLHYNDLLHSSYYTPYYTWQETTASPKEHFSIGSEVPCLLCGKTHVSISESFLCDACELDFGNCDSSDFFCFCEVCGRKMFVDGDDYSILESGEYLCHDCLEEHCCCCENCGEYIWSENALYEEDSAYCADCFETL